MTYIPPQEAPPDVGYLSLPHDLQTMSSVLFNEHVSQFVTPLQARIKKKKKKNIRDQNFANSLLTEFDVILHI